MISDNHDSLMVKAREVKVNYKLFILLSDNKVNLDHISISSFEVHLISDSTRQLNINTFIRSIRTWASNGKKGNTKPVLIDHLELTNGSLNYHSQTSQPINGRFDPQHFHLDHLNVLANDLAFRSDTFQMKVNNLYASDPANKIELRQLSTNFLICNQSMQFSKLQMDIGESHVGDSITLSFHRIKDLNRLIDSVQINARFIDTELTSKDLSRFFPYFNHKKDRYRFSGQAFGNISNLRLKNFDLSFGKKSNLNGDMLFSGLPDRKNTFMDLHFNQGRLKKGDLKAYIKKSVNQQINPFGNIQFSGDFTGYPTDFVSQLTVDSDLGKAITNINIKLAADPAKSLYSGELQLSEFDMNKLLNNPLFGRISMNVAIKGSGLTLHNADFDLIGNIDQLVVDHYNYQDISVNGQFAQEFFSGSFTIDDPNLVILAKAHVDLRNHKNQVILDGSLLKSNLSQLGWIKEDASLTTDFNINISGFSLDSLQGSIILDDLKARYLDRSLNVRHLSMTSDKNDEHREVNFITNRVNAHVDGDFNFTTLFADGTRLYRQFILNLENREDTLVSYYSKTLSKPAKYYLNFKAQLMNINELTHLFYPNISFSSNTKIEGSYRSGQTSILQAEFSNDTLKINDNLILKNKLVFFGSKQYNQRDVLASLDLTSDSQQLTNGAKLQDLIISGVWDQQIIDFNLFFNQPNYRNINDLYGKIMFLKDTTRIQFNPSNIKIFDHTWQIDHRNLVYLSRDQLTVKNLTIRSKSQRIAADGILSSDSTKNLTISFGSVQLNNLNTLITKKLEGIVDGHVTITTPFTNPVINTHFIIDSTSVNDFEVGRIEQKMDWNDRDKDFDILFSVSKDRNKQIFLNGTYQPLSGPNTLNLRGRLDSAQLNLIEPFSQNLFSSFSGVISGDIAITGTVPHPILSGQGQIESAGLTVDYLNTHYRVSGNWSADTAEISLKQLQVIDQFDHVSILNASIYHQNFTNFNLDIHATLNNMMVLNTTEKDNKLYYGTGFATGSLEISGPINDVVINARASTDKGTRFFIPVGDHSSIQKQNFISFQNLKDTLKNRIEESIQKDVSYKLITLNFDLEITPDAYSEIIFDLTVGDIIRGRGNGNLSMKIDTNGEFTMFGNYEFTEGGYNFTMYNIVNKEFKILPKSTISWSGDPYGGEMNIDATYHVVTSLAPLVDTVYQNLPEMKRIYPSEVLLDLNGPLLSPKIAFKILIEDYPKSNADLDTQVKAFLSKIEANEQELNRQVFSLLVLRKFSRPNEFASGGTLGSSVSEFISNQLSYWISQVDENLTVDIDLGKMNQDALSTFQLRVSYSFMNGKLIVTRDGGFTNPNNETTLQSVTGDWTLEYLLSKDRKLRVKLFNKTNYNQLSSAAGADNQALVTGGFSLIYSTSFNSLQDLFHSKKRNNRVPDPALNSNSAILTQKEDDN